MKFINFFLFELIYLKKRFGENLIIETKVDKSLIGGFLAKSGDDVIDASIKGKLEKLKIQIT